MKEHIFSPYLFQECPRDKLPAAIRIVTKLPFKPKLAHVNFYKRLIVDTLRAPDKSGLSLEYPQMYLEDRKTTAANLVNHVSPSPPPSAPSMLQQQLPPRLDPSCSDTQSTVLSVRWGFSTVLSLSWLGLGLLI